MQKIFTTYKAAVNSFPLGEKLIGLMKPGRYNGYDLAVSPNNDLNVVISHSGSIPKTDADGTYSPEFGAVIMPTGIVIHEYDPVNVLLVNNIGGSNDRIDYLICEHEYEEEEVLPPAYYSIVQGPPTGEEPILPNPSRQVIIGKFTVPVGAYLFEHVEYQTLLPELLGDSKTLYQIIQELVDIPVATFSEPGIIQLATIPEMTAGLVSNKAIVPSALANFTATLYRRGLSQIASSAEVVAGLDGDKYVTPATLKIITEAIQQTISDINLTVPDATALIKGVIQIATTLEVQEGNVTTKAVTPATLSSRLATPTTTGLIRLATVQDFNNQNDNTAITPKLLADMGVGEMVFTHGIVTVTQVSGLTSSQDASTNHNNNYFDITPPAGFSVANNLVTCIPSIARIRFRGTVDKNDTLWCKWIARVAANKVRVYAGNSEQRDSPQINYVCIWRK